MKITCPTCSARYALPDEKVLGKLAKIRCRKCSSSVQVDGRVEPPVVTASGAAQAADETAAPSAPTATADAASAPKSYSVDLGEAGQPAMTVAEIVAAYHALTVTAETFVWADGMAEWTPLGEVAELVDALHAAAAALEAGEASVQVPAFAEPVSEPTGSALDDERTPTAFDDESVEPPPVSTGASYEPVPVEAQSEREPATGARRDSSVLFSLSALTSSHSSPMPSAPLGGPTEDSGLIDLSALSAKPDTAPAPFLGEVALPVMTQTARAAIQAAAPQPKKKNGVLLGVAGVAALAAAVALGSVLARSPAAQPAPTATQNAPVVATPPVASPEPDKATLAAKTEPTPTTTDGSEATKPAKVSEPVAPLKGKVKKNSNPGADTKKQSGTSVKTDGGDAPVKADKPVEADADKKAVKPPPTKPVGTCGCAPTDLMCNISCRSKQKAAKK